MSAIAALRAYATRSGAHTRPRGGRLCDLRRDEFTLSCAPVTGRYEIAVLRTRLSLAATSWPAGRLTSERCIVAAMDAGAHSDELVASVLADAVYGERQQGRRVGASIADELARVHVAAVAAIAGDRAVLLTLDGAEPAAALAVLGDPPLYVPDPSALRGVRDLQAADDSTRARA